MPCIRCELTTETGIFLTYNTTAFHLCHDTDLLVGHELERRLRSNLENVDAIASPQRPSTTLYQHVLKTTDQAQPVPTRAMHLQQYT